MPKLCFLFVQYLSLIHSGMGDIEPDPLPEGTGDGVGGVDPAVGVQHVLRYKRGQRYEAKKPSWCFSRVPKITL